MLTKMARENMDFGAALKLAQSLGYAETIDPSADVDGIDAQRKISILASLAFGRHFFPQNVPTRGIRDVSVKDIALAARQGAAVRLIAWARRGDDGSVALAVEPMLIPRENQLAGVEDVFNAIAVTGNAVGDVMFYGRGAGGAPTASAVVGDVVTEARHIAQGCTGPSIPLYKDLKKAPIEASKAEFAVRFVIHDNPGVLAAIAAKFADHGVSINGVNQDLKPTLKDPGYDGELQQLRLVTHMTDELTLRETVKDVCELDCVCGEPSILRVLN